MRAVVLVLLVFAAAAVAAQPQPVQVVPVPVSNLRAVSPPTPVRCTPTPWIDPAAVWQPLARMSPQERANAKLTITADSPEVREVEAMWNRGEYDAAIAALRQWAELADLRHVYVGFNWREPIQSLQTGWGPNVRVGTRDSAYRVALDRNNSTGNLMVVSVCQAGAQTNLFADLSTDGGSTWAETHYGYWSGASVVTDLEMAGSGGFEYAVILFSTIPESAYVYRCDAATGAYVKLPDSSWSKAVLGTSVSGDTLDEVAITSMDDEYLGAELDVVGGTKLHLIEAGYSDDLGANWGLSTACSNFYWGGLDYCFNHWDAPGDRFVFLSCLYNDGWYTYPAFAFYDTMWHQYYINERTQPFGGTQNTGIAAWKDTVVLTLVHGTPTGRAIRCFFSYDAFNIWTLMTDLTDSASLRENVSICGRHGDGIGAVWRDYAGGGRWVGYRHSDYVGTSWTGPDTVSDHEADWVERPRIQRVAPGVYGVCYVSWDEPGYGGIWFTRDDWTGIAGPAPERVVPTGLAAAPHRGGARLSFTNPSAGPVRLSVFDAAGRRVLSCTQQLKPGAQTLDCAVPASGSYIAVLKTAAATATTKFSTLKWDTP